ncbi:MAG: response regulator transcription factor [Ignavibacteriaceae bacterium]|jgi:DNA-binding response OmpR family regulator|nr:response regulator transcription factor [Ignavibacteriaceae bacterium]MCW9066322.1 response regulator transcription factor [Ignavibacteriaceae bacterium]
MKILVVEDEKKVASFLKKGLEQEYYTVDVAHEGRAGLDLSLTEDYDMIILDIMLPLMDGITVLKEIRNAKLDVPVLMLTAKDSTENKVEGLDSGADDYLAKPFALEELLARVRALIRRKEKVKNLILSAEDLTLDTQTHKVKKGEIEINLTPKEYSILEYLLRNKNHVVSRMKLTEHVYEYQFDPDTNVIDVYINKLRNKIDKDSEQRILHTIRGIGYMIKENR